MKYKTPLLLVIGFATGLGFAAVSKRQEQTKTPSPVRVLGGNWNGHRLRPLTIRIGSNIKRLTDEPPTGEPIHAYFEINGEWTGVVYDLEKP